MRFTFLVLLVNVIFFLMNISGAFAEFPIAVEASGVNVKSGYAQRDMPSPAYDTLISAGSYHTVSIKANQTVVAAGYNLNGQCDVSSWSQMKQVSAGEHHTVGLKTDGTVVAVGSNFYGQCNVSLWKNIKQVSAGDYHTVGLKTDGSVVAVGYDYAGQCDVSYWSDILQVAAGGHHTVGLKSDGTVVAVGYNLSGQCNVFSWSEILQVAAGGHHTVGLKSDGTVVAAGYNLSGQCNVFSWSEILQVAAGGHHTVGLKTDGTVVAVGYNLSGQCDVSSWSDMAQVCAGAFHTAGLKNNNIVVTAGNNARGQCDIDKLKISVALLSATTGESIYHIIQGEEVTLKITAWRGDAPAVNETITIASTMVPYFEMEQGGILQNRSISTDSNGEVFLKWQAGYETGAGQISISAENGQFVMDPAVAFIVIPFGGSETPDYAINIQMYSTIPDENIYSIDKGETAYLRATITKNSTPVIHEMVTFSASKGSFVNIEDGTLLSNADGIAEILWKTGDDSGAGIITVKAGEAEATRFFEIIPSQQDETLPLELSMYFLPVGIECSDIAGQEYSDNDKEVSIYINQGAERTLYIEAIRGDAPAENELLEVSSETGSFITTENGMVVTDSKGKVCLTWRAGDGTGADTISVSAINDPLAADYVTVDVTPFDTSESSGQADQDSFTFSIDDGYDDTVEGLNHNGEEVKLVVQVADRYNHPVPEGTVVDFYAEGGSITDTAKTDAAGICFATWTSQEPKPDDGRVTIMAVTKGDETFLDANDDSVYTDGVDIPKTDMPEAFLDEDEDGMYDPGVEYFLDNNGDGEYTLADGLYNGSLCMDGSGGCTNELIDIRRSMEIVMLGSFADISLSPLSATLNAASSEEIISLLIQDENENSMPDNTMVTITVPEGLAIKNIKPLKGKIKETVGEKTDEVNFSILVSNKEHSLSPVSLSFVLYITADGLENGVDIDNYLVVDVITPKGNLTYETIPVKAVVP